MKKFLPYIIVTALCVSLCACGNDDSSSSEAAVTTTKAVTTKVTTEAVTTSTTAKAETTTTKKTTKATTTTAAVTTTEEITEPEEEEEEFEEEIEEPVQSGGYVDGSDLYVGYAGGSFTLGQDIASCPAAGSFDASPSCYYEGDDKIFHYDGMDVYTYPSGDADYISEIVLLTGNVSTSRGLTVGMSVDDAVAMYGEASGGGGMYSWYCGSSYIYVYESGGTITTIGIAGQ